MSEGSSKAAQSAPKLAVVIMAAGKGTRLKSRRPKVLHEVGGKPLLSHVIATAGRLAENEDIFAIVGHEAESVREAMSGSRRAIHRTDRAARNGARNSVRAPSDLSVRTHHGSFRRCAADPGGDTAAPDDAAPGGRCGDDDSDCRAGESTGYGRIIRTLAGSGGSGRNRGAEGAKGGATPSAKSIRAFTHSR